MTTGLKGPIRPYMTPISLEHPREDPGERYLGPWAQYTFPQKEYSLEELAATSRVSGLGFRVELFRVEGPGGWVRGRGR